MDDELWPGITQRIVEARERAGLNQTELGEAIGLSKGAVGNYERGDRHPSLRELREISKATGTDFHWLLSGDVYRDPLERIEQRLADIWQFMTTQQPEGRPIADLISADPFTKPAYDERAAAQTELPAKTPRNADRPSHQGRGGNRRASR